MRDMALWKCIEEDCEDETIYRFKGLCRYCTSYDDSTGMPLKPVSRLKVTPSGEVIVAPLKLKSRAVSAADYKTFRQSQKRLTNKQKEALIQAHQHTHNEHDGPHAHIHDENCDHEHTDAEVMNIGESISEEE